VIELKYISSVVVTFPLLVVVGACHLTGKLGDPLCDLSIRWDASRKVGAPASYPFETLATGSRIWWIAAIAS